MAIISRLATSRNDMGYGNSDLECTRLVDGGMMFRAGRVSAYDQVRTFQNASLHFAINFSKSQRNRPRSSQLLDSRSPHQNAHTAFFRFLRDHFRIPYAFSPFLLSTHFKTAHNIQVLLSASFENFPDSSSPSSTPFQNSSFSPWSCWKPKSKSPHCNFLR